MPIEPPNPLSPAARLAVEHDAPTLAAALGVRLLADGRAELAGALRALVSGDAVGAVDPNPGDPHRPAASVT